MGTVTLRALHKSFGSVPVLSGVSLDIADGEFVSIVGPSGCGKSTMLRIIAGLEVQDEGAVEIDGRSMAYVRPKARDVAMVFQSYALYPHMSVERNISVPLLMRRLTTAQRLPLIGRFLPGARAVSAAIAQDVRSVAGALELTPLLGRKPGQLSGGQRQRVAVARAMVRRPKVFLMDEPLSNLDAKLRVQMRTEIKELHAKLRATFVYVTHDQSEAMTMSDRVGVMIDGELIQIAAPHVLYDDPEDIRIATFIGSPRINLIAAHVADDGSLHAAGRLLALDHRLAKAARITVGVRPEAIGLAQDDTETAMRARIRLVEHLGSDLLVHAESADGAEKLIARLEPRTGRHLRAGDVVGLTFDPAAALLFDQDGRRLRFPRERPHALLSRVLAET
ncbi:ABC transporter ATP-binding protein [Bosea eneae]|uniref:ABC transporter ATP-binding protein n=1 Tax=Bosea eneae TaxID=151454 RepID=A0ABW0IZF3_9HYPH